VSEMEALEDHSIVLQSHLVVGAAFDIVEDEIRRACQADRAVGAVLQNYEDDRDLISRGSTNYCWECPRHHAPGQLKRSHLLELDRIPPSSSPNLASTEYLPGPVT